MPHLVIQHTPNIQIDFKAFSQALLTTILSIRDEQGKQVYPEGGARVLTFPATQYAVGDGKGDYAFMYLNLRVLQGRSAAVMKDTGDKLMATIKAHAEPYFSRAGLGITLNIIETPKQLPGPEMLAYEGFHNNLRAIFGR